DVGLPPEGEAAGAGGSGTGSRGKGTTKRGGIGKRMRDFIQLFLLCVECFFILYMILYSSFLFLSVTVGSSDLYAAKRRNRLKNELSNDYYVPVSVLVPAHNEEVTIEATVRSLLTLDYKLYEIVVVDDGSTDN